MSDPHDLEHGHANDSEHDLEHESAHEHDGGVAEYVRLALMAAVIVASRAPSSIRAISPK